MRLTVFVYTKLGWLIGVTDNEEERSAQTFLPDIEKRRTRRYCGVTILTTTETHVLKSEIPISTKP